MKTRHHKLKHWRSGRLWCSALVKTYDTHSYLDVDESNVTGDTDAIWFVKLSRAMAVENTLLACEFILNQINFIASVMHLTVKLQHLSQKCITSILVRSDGHDTLNLR